MEIVKIRYVHAILDDAPGKHFSGLLFIYVGDFFSALLVAALACVKDHRGRMQT